MARRADLLSRSALDSRLLAQFLVIVRSGSFARAAVTLGVTQPSLSKSVARLERRLGVRLLERTARGVTATSYGVVLQQHVAPALAEFQAAERAIESMRGGAGAIVLLGVAPAAAADLMPLVVSELRRPAHALRLRVHEGLAEQLIAGVMDGTLDLAVTTLPGDGSEPGLATWPLHRDTFSACCAADHPLYARRARLDLADVRDAAWVLPPPDALARRHFGQCFERAGLESPVPIVETASATLSKALVSREGMLAFLPQAMYALERRQRLMRAMSLAALTWTRQVALVARRGRTLPPAVASVATVIRRCAVRESG